MSRRKKQKISKKLHLLRRNVEDLSASCVNTAISFEDIAEALQRFLEVIKRKPMVVHIEKNGVRCSIHQTLNGFMLKTSFDPLKNIKFLEEMEKHFHVTGAENELENGYNAVVFTSREYKTENIIDAVSEVLEKTAF